MALDLEDPSVERLRPQTVETGVAARSSAVGRRAAPAGDVQSSASALTTARVRATRTSLLNALALGPAVWDAVFVGAESPAPFMSWAWHRAWADWAAPEDVAASEVLLLLDPDGAVQALLPVLVRPVPFHRIRVPTLTWAIGDLGCPDHLDVLAAPETDLEPLVPVLEELPWQVLILSNVAEHAVNAGRLCESIASRGYVLRRRAGWGCPYVDLPEDWDRYLGTLTPTHRQRLRRKDRNLRRHHAVAITDYDSDRLNEGWSHLVSLHERRWVGAGAFQDRCVERLHRQFAAELAGRRELWLATLDLDGQPAAAWYGFACRDTVYFYQSGRDPRWDRESVGLVLMGAMIRRAIERGYRRFDFLRGEDRYKREWTESQRTTQEIVIFRPGWRGCGLRALDAAAELRARLRARVGRGARVAAVGDA
jgi:hypothetical protein